MAVKTGTRVRTTEGVVVYTWSDLDSTTSDTGTPMLLQDEGDVDVQLIGTLSGSVVAMQGSNDGTNWAAITMSPTPLVAATISRLSQRAKFIRPSITGGTGVDLVVIATVTPGKV